MTSLRTWALGAVLAAASTAAWAFQEQQSGSAPVAKSPIAPEATAPGAGLTSAPAIGGKGLGTEIKIPGLGSLGVLPKMDFGLELLYGAAETKAGGDSRMGPPESDDLAIKGTLRRKF